MSDIVIEERYVSLQGTFTIPNIKTKNFLSFSFCATKTGQYYISGKETFDLRAIKKTYAASNYKIIKNINNLNIIAEIDISNGTLIFSGDNLYGTIYTHNT